MRLLWIATLAACGSTAPAPKPKPPETKKPVAAQDLCAVAFDKLAPMVERRFQTKISPDERAKGLEECRAGDKEAMVVVECIAKAADDDAIVACMQASEPKKKLDEPHPDLDQLVENLRIYHISHEVLLAGNVALTPAKACCSYPDHLCPAGEWKAETWNIVGLDNTKARHFQFRFEGTRSKVVVEAVGDLDCDGKLITFRRELEMRADGNMHITVVDPKPEDD